MLIMFSVLLTQLFHLYFADTASHHIKHLLLLILRIICIYFSNNSIVCKMSFVHDSSDSTLLVCLGEGVGRVNQSFWLPREVAKNIWRILPEINSEILKKYVERTEWNVGSCGNKPWIITIVDRVEKTRYRVQLNSACGYYQWTFANWTRFSKVLIDCFGDEVMEVDEGLEKTVTLTFEKDRQKFIMPLNVWFAIVDCQEQIDHNLNLKMYSKWNLGGDTDDWDIEVSCDLNGESLVQLHCAICTIEWIIGINLKIS